MDPRTRFIMSERHCHCCCKCRAVAFQMPRAGDAACCWGLKADPGVRSTHTAVYLFPRHNHCLGSAHFSLSPSGVSIRQMFLLTGRMRALIKSSLAHRPDRPHAACLSVLLPFSLAMPCCALLGTASFDPPGISQGLALANVTSPPHRTNSSPPLALVAEPNTDARKSTCALVARRVLNPTSVSKLYC